MKATYKLLLVISLFLLIGCGKTFSEVKSDVRRSVISYGDYVKLDITMDDIKNSEFAYVVGRFDGRNEWLHTSRSYKDSYEKNEVVELSYMDNLLTNDYSIYRVIPGKFTLIYFSTNNENVKYFLSENAQKENEKIKETSSYYASFEVEKGEIYYVGDITITGDKKFKVINNKKGVINYLSEHYKELKNIKNHLIYEPAKEGEFFSE